jgi:quercetin dioxygenase-like cupin family protein
MVDKHPGHPDLPTWWGGTNRLTSSTSFLIFVILLDRRGRSLMPSIERPLSGDMLVFDLDEELTKARSNRALKEHGRIAKTLAKDGPLRVILVVLDAGGTLEEHQTAGPVTIQPLEGDVRLSLEGTMEPVAVGQLITLGAGVPHGVESRDGGAFLLTVCHPPAATKDGP